MDFSPLIYQILQLWWLVPIFFGLALLQSPWFKGKAGEVAVKLSAKVVLPTDTYHAMHDVTLPTDTGTTQIDHIFVSRFGIFVVETKNMKGWIFGSETQAQWTQKIFRESYKFQNPLRQNYKHVKTLEAVLDAPPNSIHSVVVFVGECELKTPMPPNVTTGSGYLRYIKSFGRPILTDRQVSNAIAIIQSGRLTPSRQTNRQHVEHLKSRSIPANAPKCPKCGGSMVSRIASKGVNAGGKFWGCSNYPRCKGTLSNPS